MKNRVITNISLISIAALLLTSCAELPQAEIDTANTAVEQAKMDGAEIYVHKDFVALQDSLKGVMTIVESQKSKWFKNYTQAKEHLAGVTQFAKEVSQLAEVRKEELKEEIQKTITDVKILIESNRQLILEAPKGKEGNSALVALKGEIDAIETSVIEVNTLFDKGEYITTLDKAKVAKEKATAINTELSAVITKYKSNSKG